MAPAEGRGSSTGPGTRGALSHVWMREIQTMAVESLPGPGAGSPGQGVSQGSGRESVPGRARRPSGYSLASLLSRPLASHAILLCTWPCPNGPFL